MIFPLSATSQSIDIEIFDDSGLPVTGLVAATFPTLTYSLAGANADVSFPALSDLATITTAYASGGVKERGNGVYRLDLPNGVFTTAGQVRIRGEATGKHVVCPWLEIAPSVASVVGAVGSVTGAVGSVTGAVGSVTGNIGGSVVGDVQGKVLGGGASALAGVGVQADLQTIKTQTVTCAAGVTILPNVGTATHALVVDASGFVTVATNNDKTGYSLTQAFPTNFAALGIGVTGHITTVDTATNLTNAPTAGDFTAAMKTSLNAATPAVTVSDKTGFRLATEIHSGTATAGGTSTITLDAGASATASLYNGNWITITGGSGLGQSRLITAYTTGKVATVSPAWAVVPDATSAFTIVPAGDVLGVDGNVSGNVNGSVNSVATGVTLAASQHVIVDSGTVTTLTNLPAIPANWLTAAGIAAGALNGKGDWLLAASYGTTAFTESLPAVGAAMTEAQLLYEIRSLLAGDSVSGGTMSTDTVAGTAKATYTLTLDGGGNPIAITRAT